MDQVAVGFDHLAYGEVAGWIRREGLFLGFGDCPGGVLNGRCVRDGASRVKQGLTLCLGRVKAELLHGIVSKSTCDPGW